MESNINAVRILKGISFKTISNAVMLFFGFIMSIILNRHYGAETYGLLILVFSVTSIANIVYEVGLKSTLNRYIPIYSTQGRHDKVVKSVVYSFLLILISIAFISLLLLLSSRFISLHVYKKESLVPILQFGVIFFIGYAFFDFLLSIFQALQDWFYESLLSALYPLLYFIFTLIAIFIFHAFLSGVLISNAIASFLTGLVGLYFLIYRLDFFKEVNFSIASFKEFFTTYIYFGFPMLLGGFNLYGRNWFDKIILGKYGDLQSLSFYYIATSFFMAIMQPFRVLHTVFMPYLAGISQSSEENIREKFYFLFRWFLILASVTSIIMFFIIRPIVITLYGIKYIPVVFIFQLLLIIFLIRNSLQTAAMYIVNVYGETKKTVSAGIILTLSIIIFDLIFIPWYGAYGAIIALIISYLIYWIAILIIFKKIRELIPFIFLFKAIFSLTFLFIIYNMLLMIGITNVFILPIFILMGYSFFAYFFKMVQLSDVALIKDILRKLTKKDKV